MGKRLSTQQKMTLQFMLGVVVILAGLVMLFMGIWINPLGVIDSSILVAFGETATFSGALIGIDYTYKYKHYLAEENRKNNEGEENE